MSNYKKYILLILPIGVINLLLLYYIKYSSNQLSLEVIDISKTGNLINFFLTLLLILGCLLLYRNKNEIHIGHLKVSLSLSIIYLFPLMIILFFNSLHLEFADEYLFGYPFKKIIPLILFLINQIIFLFVLFTVWYIYFGHSLLSYLYSVLSIAATIILLLIMTLFYTFFVNEYDYNNEGSKFDYGIILGAAVWSGDRPSPIFSGRIDKGAKLYLDTVIHKIHVTGGNAPGEVSEAKAAYNYLTEKYNIKSDHILIEEFTATTNEQIRYITKTFSKNKVDGTFLFISDEFHLRRIVEMADFYDLNAKVVSSDYKLNFQKSLFYRLRDSIGLILFWFFAI